MKLHIGCQQIYLTGYVNIDVPGAGGLARDYPARVERYQTTEDAYYARKDYVPGQIIAEGPESNDGDVCDVYGTFQNLPFDDASADEILSRQCFEHLSRIEAGNAMLEARRVLKPGGLLRLDVPDHDETIKQWEEAIRESELYADSKKPKDLEKLKQCQERAELMKRHLLGSRKNDFAYHMGSWTRDALKEFAGRYGFELVEEEPNIHFYPAFCFRLRKADLPKGSPFEDGRVELWKAAWEYCGKHATPLTVPEHWSCLEIGPGLFPWERANYYGDIDEGNVQRLRGLGKSAESVNIEALPADWTDRFDFVLTSHVLEHTEDPIAAAGHLSRVARHGVVICPSPMKDGLFAAHEVDHKWHVLAGKGCLYFHRIPIVYNADGQPSSLYSFLYNANVSGQAHRQWRYGDRRLEGLSEEMRRWWHSAEPYYDTIFHWDGKLKVVVCE